jgi:hypothetical protein
VKELYMVDDGLWAMPLRGRSAPLRAEPASPSQAKRAAAIAGSFTFTFPDAAIFCEQCNAAFVYEDGLCRDCWNEINGQFGVGA